MLHRAGNISQRSQGWKRLAERASHPLVLYRLSPANGGCRDRPRRAMVRVRSKAPKFRLNLERGRRDQRVFWFTVGKCCGKNVCWPSSIVVRLSSCSALCRAFRGQKICAAAAGEVVVSLTSLVSVFQARMAAAFALVLWAVALASPSSAAVPERRVALVIGNSAYTAVPPLANPQRDAKGISAALKRLGFDVVEGYDLKMDEMTGVVREFAQKLDGAKAGLVYYAGHGIAVGDDNYLIPVDASLRSEADLDFRAVNVQLILRQMQRDERVNIVILDACRDNPFAAQLAAKSRAVTRGLTAIETQSASGILIAFATDPRATALDGERDGNSPFTSALLKHIETPEVSITTVMDRVRADVWETTGKKQKPWTNSSIIGEFRLNPTLKLAS